MAVRPDDGLTTACTGLRDRCERARLALGQKIHAAADRSLRRLCPSAFELVFDDAVFKNIAELSVLSCTGDSARERLPRLGRSPTPSSSGVVQRSPVNGWRVVVEAELLGLSRHLVEDGSALATLALPRLGLAPDRATVLPWSHHGHGREMGTTAKARNRSRRSSGMGSGGWHDVRQGTEELGQPAARLAIRRGRVVLAWETLTAKEAP